MPSRTSYKYEDTAITGFMGTHQPALWMGDYGYVTLMPEIGPVTLTPDARKLAYVHPDEVARPDYYSVWMTAGGGRRIRTELTASQRHPATTSPSVGRRPTSLTNPATSLPRRGYLSRRCLSDRFALARARFYSVASSSGVGAALAMFGLRPRSRRLATSRRCSE